ncbi:LOW QUALITY PROTEIN: Hypothetical protein PHPALM_2159 [Phytophthora palmivora]|uniref:HTH CENPB-type domain-containing protein n=1 Tax=Phytophthora palmivora TaxID=4796 RepID=A0A2P4YQF9_9STRA|nr:LOW QUALITY PROTEIN: Hypothetical protein PHPALM_2159 [Phytophthora palmivora]
MRVAVRDKKRGKNLTVGDALCGWIKDERRDERPVALDDIVARCMAMLPGFMDAKTSASRKSWCSRFMKRYGLTIRRISHSGRNKHPELLALQEAALLIDHFLDTSSGAPPPYVLYNMAQTAVYGDVGATTTVDFVGVTRVPANGAGKGSYRCTAALLACADGRMLPPHFGFAGEPGNDVHREVPRYCVPSVATFSVQAKAWFSERVMLEWIEQQYEVHGPSVLILDCLKVHKCVAVRRRLAEMGTYTVYVPAGCTSVAQPLDVGVMAPFKSSLRARYTELYSKHPPPRTASHRRYDMFQRAMQALHSITTDTVKNAFIKAGPFIPFGPAPQPAAVVVSTTEVIV